VITILETELSLHPAMVGKEGGLVLVYSQSRAILQFLPDILYSRVFLISTIITGLFLLSRIIIIKYLKRNNNTSTSNFWSQLSNMEKASSKPSSTLPPSATACDVLKPLSQNGNFPSSGAVANKVREQMQMQMQKNGNSLPASSAPNATQPRSGSGIESGSDTQSTPSATASVQRRSESVQQMREVDGDGVRTWRRLVVEYN